MRLVETILEGTQAVPHVAQILPVPDVSCGSARLFEVRAHFAGPKSPLQLGPRWQHRRHAIATNILFCAVRKMFCSCAARAQKLCIMAAVPHASKTRPGFLTCVTLPTQAFRHTSFAGVPRFSVTVNRTARSRRNTSLIYTENCLDNTV